VTRAYVGLGSNLGDREDSIAQALAAIAAEPEIMIVRVSSVRETEPVDYLDQPKFLNAAVLVETTLSPQELLDRLLAIELTLGRRRDGPRQGPRTIDLDLLLHGEARMDEPDLQLPHPRLHERRFALESLAELTPGLVVPGHGPVEALLAGLD
jgi:2-amino-4-hydroxy-6-hydroxymethyldihydropteridine diphosphokinase